MGLWPFGQQLAGGQPLFQDMQDFYVLIWVWFRAFCDAASRASVQHHEREEPNHGGRPEEEAGDEATPGGESGGQEDFLCQLHGHLQAVSMVVQQQTFCRVVKTGWAWPLYHVSSRYQVLDQLFSSPTHPVPNQVPYNWLFMRSRKYCVFVKGRKS